MRSHDVVAANVWILTAFPALLVAVMPAVLTPLALTAAGAPRWLVRAAWPAGALAGIGLVVLDSGGLATVSVAPYAGVTAVAGAIGLARLTRRPGAAGAAIAGGLMFLPAAATWLIAYQVGYALLDYPPFWVVLTAAHFHTAGAYLPIVAGRAAAGRRAAAGAVAVAAVLAVPVTAAGIFGPRWLELAGSLAMAVSAAGAGVVLVTTPGRAPRIAGAILLVTMPLAALFALRDHGTALRIAGLDELGSMLVSHGALNALGFALAGLLGFTRAPAPRPTTT